MILLNDFARQWRDTSEDACAAFTAVGESGWYILGNEVRQFERELAALWQTDHAVGVASGLDAIEISLRVLGCTPGDRVLTTPISAFATTLAIVKAGGVPVFADVDASGSIDLDGAREAMHADPRIKFFLPVHLYGHALDLEKISAMQREFGVAVIEDCAQAVLARSREMPLGSIGRMAATSFYPTKNLGAMGDGGAILTGNEEYAKAARMFRDYGQSAKYRHSAIGYNSRLDELQAALLRRAGLPRLERWTERRRKIAQTYLDRIANPALRIPPAPAGSHSCWHLFPLLVPPEHKPAFLAHLKGRGIGAGEHYPVAIPDQPALAGAAFDIAACGIERARIFCCSEVSLPIHPYLNDSEIGVVVDAVNSWAP
ncbi:MAG TPA: DegT/DnrJ/EryC1/StrS family aminotransferase [Bryobacteraceae bacterium]